MEMLRSLAPSTMLPSLTHFDVDVESTRITSALCRDARVGMPMEERAKAVFTRQGVSKADIGALNHINLLAVFSIPPVRKGI